MFDKFNKFKIIWSYPALCQVPPYVLNLYKTPCSFRPCDFHYNFSKKAPNLRLRANFFSENYWSPGLRPGFLIYYINSKHKLIPSLNSFT